MHFHRPGWRVLDPRRLVFDGKCSTAANFIGQKIIGRPLGQMRAVPSTVTGGSDLRPRNSRSATTRKKWLARYNLRGAALSFLSRGYPGRIMVPPIA